MKKLPVFPSFMADKWSLHRKMEAVQSPSVLRVISFVLGPEGTNIHQAATLWHTEMGIEAKAEVQFCNLPETAVKESLAVRDEGVLGVFWTCAVFKRLHEIFFKNPETFPFFFSQDMLLDEMQLAVPEGSLDFSSEDGFEGLRVASHVSPAPLLESMTRCGAVLVDASSNSEAARMCAAKEVDACITTESGRDIHRLRKLHSFGSPLMVFFGGITAGGLHLLDSTAVCR